MKNENVSLIDEDFVQRMEALLNTHMVNGFVVPAPEIEPLQVGQIFFQPNPGEPSWASSYAWSNLDSDMQMLERGLVQLSRSAAIANAKAMVMVDPFVRG